MIPDHHLMRNSFWSLLLLPLVISACAEEAEPTSHTRIEVMPPLHVDQIYPSMAGPMANGSFALRPGPPQILWITAYRTEVVEVDGSTPASGEFMCHTNLLLRDGQEHKKRFGWNKRVSRLFTTSQGQFELELPEGFGIPVLSNEPLFVNTQILNHNIEDADLHVRFRVSVDYVSDADAGDLRPIYPTMAYVMALIEGDNAYYGVQQPSEIQEGASCLPGHVAPQAGAMGLGILKDDLGQQFTGHWVVPAGREERRTLVTKLLDIPVDTSIHAIATHLHPFAESLTLRDLTTGETLYKAGARGPEEGLGLAWVSSYSSGKGIPVFADHDYEMVSIYDNTSGEDQDAMASFVLYLHDNEAEQGLEALRASLAGAGG
jgi:hypothetical protein